MTDEIRITLRLPAGIHATVKSSAENNKRSMNEEIVQALLNYYNMADEINRRLEKLEKFMTELQAQNG
jgi:hypothetical protein